MWIILVAFSIQNLGAISTFVYGPQFLKSKSGSKEPQNRLNLSFERSPIDLEGVILAKNSMGMAEYEPLRLDFVIRDALVAAAQSC